MENHCTLFTDNFLAARARMLEQVQQVLSLSVPSPEILAGPDLAPESACIANHGTVEMFRTWPHNLPTFVALLPMNNLPAALIEMDHAIDQLGARGIWILTNVNGRALGNADYFSVFERMAYPKNFWCGCTRCAPRKQGGLR